MAPRMLAASDPVRTTRLISDEFVDARFCAPAAISWLERLKEEPRGCDDDDCFCSSAALEFAGLITESGWSTLDADGGCICY